MSDERLGEQVETAVYERIYPLIQEIENELGVGISHFLMTNMARRLATTGVPLDELIADVREAYAHQLSHNKSFKLQ
jgi:hypothetical protein